MPLPSIGGGTGRGVFVYKSVAEHRTLPQSDLDYLKDQYNKGAIALVHNTAVDRFYRYENVGGSWVWNERSNFATGNKGDTGAKGIGITSITFNKATTAGDVYNVNLSDGSHYEITAPKGVDGTGDSKDLIKIFGDQATDPKAGRIRYNDKIGHWVFEVKQPDGSYKNKLEVGGSIMVDVLRLIQGEKPINIPTTEMGLYMAEVSIGGVDQIRPYWVLSNGDEYGVVVHDEQTGHVVYRQKDGQLGRLKTVAEIDVIEQIAKNGIHTMDFDTSSYILSGKDSDGHVIENIDLSPLATGGINLSNYLKKDLEDIDLAKLYDKGIDAKLADAQKVTDNTNEITKLKSNIGGADKKIYDYRKSTLPTNLNDDNTIDEYYITLFTLPSANLELITPNPSGNIKDGTVFCLENNDPSKVMYLKPASGYTINGKSTNYKVRPNTLNYLVKNGFDWNVGFAGYLPANLSALVDDLKGKLGILTIDEIEQQLIAKGFEKSQDEIKYGYISGVPSDASGLTNIANADQDVTIAPTNEGSRYLAVLIPDFMHPLVQDLIVNGQKEEPRVYGIVVGDDNFKILVSPTPVNTDAQVTFNLSYGDSTVTTMGLEFDDGSTDSADVRKVNMGKGLEITKTDVQNEIDINAVTNWENMDGMGNGRTDTVLVEEPIEVYIDPDSPTGQDRMKMRLKHGYYEFKWASGYLAYANYNTEVVGKINNNVKTGKIWFDDEVVPGGTYVYPSKSEKIINIQETDQLDPNITGGTNFLTAYRLAIKGHAPSDGYVKIYLRNKMTQQIINDVNGNPFEIKRRYKNGDRFGYLECISVINAKGLKQVEMFVEDNFVDDTLVIEDRTQGISGIMFQALSSKGKTGKALLDYEVSTMQAIEFTHHYYGEDFMTIDYIAKQNQPIVTGLAGAGMTMEDGFHFYNTTTMQFGTQDNHLVFRDDGSHMVYFNFGKIYNAEQTYALRGKQIDVSVILTDKDSAWNVQLVKWTGLPNEYTDKIITDISNVTPTMETNWALVPEGKMFISEDVVVGDHTATGQFTVPTDAVNFGIIIYPVEKSQPKTLKLKQFTANIHEPFNGWTVHSPHLIGEEHLRYSHEYLKTGMNNEGMGGLRFTINAQPTKMPVGYKVKGNANIKTNPVWQVGVKPNGEGVFEFDTDGIATISPTVRIKRGEKAVGDQTITFEWKKKVRNLGNPAWSEADYDRVNTSLYSYTMKATDTAYEYVTQPSFKVQVKAGDLVGFWLHADVDDGAFLQSDASNQDLVSVVINFDEITEDEAEILENIKEVRFTQEAKDAGVYLEIDYDPITSRPSVSPKIS